jgi:4-hydroxy-2-oxoheptanedioate aldolase
MRPNRIRKLWARGEAAVNGWLLIPSAFSAELVAKSGFDCLLVDMQHGVIGYETMVGMLQAISTTGTMPLVRVLDLDAGMIGKVLDAGAYGIICPMVNTRAQAEALVRAAKYPPRGLRSFGPARAVLYAGFDYPQGADDEIVLLAMIETAEALANVDEILSVPGIDVAYIGPADLSISLGLSFPTNPPHPKLVDAIETIRAACERHDVVAGVHTVPGITPAEFIRQGFRFVTTGIDMEFILGGASAASSGHKPSNSSQN